ncbi:MAG: Holliday junction branch migration protein RuvA [Chloroflexi bacterium]|nr:Holliday junction branch migration protein RuvA [Chloroflexota bacterium]
MAGQPGDTEGNAMIAGLKGRLEAVGGDGVVLQVGGFSLRVQVPAPTLSVLGPAGSEVRLHIHLYLREEVVALYGFATQEELAVFERLLTVPRMGPRLALALLSSLGAGGLVAAVTAGDIDRLAQVPGIGKKTASHLVLELKGKLDSLAVAAVSPGAANAEVVSALASLGYTLAEARQAVQDLPPSGPVEERLRQALQRLSRA